MAKKVLVVDDEKLIVKGIRFSLEQDGMEVECAYDGEEALSYAHAEQNDGIILDVMMPKKSGLQVLKELRAEGCKTPILLLTAKAEVEDRIEGLDLGADDYLPKPFVMGELLARVRAMLRRREEFTPNVLTCGGVSLNQSTYTSRLR